MITVVARGKKIYQTKTNYKQAMKVWLAIQALPKS